MLKKIIKKILHKKGWIVKPIGYETNALHLILLYALGVHKQLNIVQIGASDGVFGDPLRTFILTHAKDLQMIFFEPQREPFEKLKNNYQNYPHFIFVNKAIGAPGILTFYSINEKCRELIKQKTGRTIGTGANSFIKEHLIVRMKKFGIANFDQYMDTEQRELVGLLDEIRKYEELSGRIDLLQIDCEGYDDEVIYHSAIETIKPMIINFESKNLSASKLQNLASFLENNGYILTPWTKSDTLAIKNNQQQGETKK